MGESLLADVAGVQGGRARPDLTAAVEGGDEVLEGSSVRAADPVDQSCNRHKELRVGRREVMLLIAYMSC